MLRSGVIAKKVGMTRLFMEDGRKVPVTVLQLENLQVVAQRTLEKDGYTAVQLGAGAAKARRVNKALRNHFSSAHVSPKRKLAEFRVDPKNLIGVGEEITADHYFEGQYVDVAGTSIGKGFAGPMKRHNFGGLRASHGVSVSHRSHGSTGQCQNHGRVFKGKKMAGQMGSVRVTTQNLEVVKTDADRGLIMVKGAVPGSKGGWVTIKDAVKKPVPEQAVWPAALREKTVKIVADRHDDKSTDLIDGDVDMASSPEEDVRSSAIIPSEAAGDVKDAHSKNQAEDGETGLDSGADNHSAGSDDAVTPDDISSNAPTVDKKEGDGS